MSVAEILLLIMWVVGMVPAWIVTEMAGETTTTSGERFSKVSMIALWPAAIVLGLSYMALASLFGWED